MNHWLGIALVAYLIGGTIEGVSTASQLSQLLPLAKSTPNHPSESWRVFTAIASVSICGAFCWPCRLLHRAIKEQQTSQKE